MSILIAILIYALIGQAPVAGVPGTIQGTVCEITTCRPVVGARLVLSNIGGENNRRTAVTDLAGTFRFAQVPPGKYRLAVDADNHAASTILPFVEVTDGASIDGLKIEMRALGTISGRALDENGDPLVGARVVAMAFRPDDYFRMLTPIGDVDSDDRGEFRISALDPDEYYIRVLPSADSSVQRSFPTTYYPNTTDPSIAAKIVVAAGSEIAGIDPRLPSRGVKVSGQIVRPQADTSHAVLFLLPRSPSVFVLPSLSQNQVDQTKGDFELSGVAPGSYYLYVITRAEENAEWVRFPLEVGDKDIEKLTLHIIPAGSIKGRITFANDASDAEKLDLSKITLDASAVDWVPGSPRTGARAQVAKSGEFQFAHLSEMRLFLRNQNLPDKWFLSAVRFDGSDVMTAGFSAAPGKEGNLEVVISNAGGTLAGVIKDQQDKPVPAGRLVLLPELSRRSNPFLVRTGVAIERGEFTVETIPPGEYTAIAFPDEDQFTPAFLRDMQTVEKYERFGQRVHVGARETTRMDIRVAPVEPK